MDVRLIISASESLLLTFILKEGHIHEIKVEKRKARRIAGSVFKGMVRRIAKSLGGAFVDIGLEKEAYLPLKESQAPLKEGSEVIVQVKREPIEDKGAKLTQRVSIPGKYLVYLPTSSHIYVSSKIGDEETRKRLREFFEKSLRGDGVIVRTCARWLDEDVLIQELDFLRKKWESIKESAKAVKTGLVYEEIPLHLQAIRDHWFEIGEVVIDNRGLWSAILSFIEKEFPDLIGKVRFVRDLSVFFKKYGLDSALGKLFTKYVWLKGGGYIVVEETEAMTVIDVNSGSGCGDTLEENALRTNLEAAEEIVKQIKLRDIGGIIVIDFIDMKERKNREKLIKRIRDLFVDEGSKVHVYGITPLGLLEITRKKESPSSLKLLSERCPHCRGRGLVKSRELILYEIEKEIAYFKGRNIQLRVSPMIKGDVERLLKEAHMDAWVSLKEICDAPPDYYEMILTD